MYEADIGHLKFTINTSVYKVFLLFLFVRKPIKSLRSLRLCAALIQATKRSLYSLAVAYIACDFIEFVGNVNRYVRIFIDQKLCM